MIPTIHTARSLHGALVNYECLTTRSKGMKENEYEAAEAVEIGKAEEVILGHKVEFTSIDSSGGLPMDWLYQEP